MSDRTEDLVREVFAADAAAAPEPAALTDLVVRRVRRRRRVQAAGAVVAAAAAVGAVLMAGPWQSGPRPLAALPAVTSAATASSTVPAPVTPPGRPGEPSGGGSSLSDSCVAAYSPAAVAGAPFAFDGTVLAIGSARSNRPGVELPLSGVTFRVHQWFRGGHGSTVVVDLDTVRPPNVLSEPSVAPYRVGTRLLVSGAPRWGGRPLDAAIAWPCGFTRPYDAQTAAAWAAATR
jgi:hypothetical protein